MYIAHLLRDQRNIIYFQHTQKKIEERKQNPNNSLSILLKRPIYVCTFSLFELEKNVMQLLSKAQKKEKHNNFFFKDTPESFVATSNSLKPFYKKNSEKDAMCSSMW